MTEPYVTRLDRAKQKACPFGVAEKCLGDGCAAWVPDAVWESEIAGKPHVFPKKTFLQRIFGAGFQVAPIVRGVEHGKCSRIE